MSANLVFAAGSGNMILPFVVDVYKATCKVGCQTHHVIPHQGVYIWIRLAWNACEAAVALAAEPIRTCAKSGTVSKYVTLWQIECGWV